MSHQMVWDPRELAMSAPAVTLAKNCADVLNKHYPEHLWGVHVDDEGGVLKVYNLALSGRWGFVLHIVRIDPELRAVVRAGGELLERYRLKRGRLDVDKVAELKTDFAGNKVFDRD